MGAQLEHQTFVSCEDRLPIIVDGYHNFACTVTAVIIMYIPMRVFWMAYSQSLGLAAMVYAGCLTSLFFSNLHHHATGHSFPDLETGGCFVNLALACIVNDQIYHLKRHLSFPPVLFKTVAVGTSFILLAMAYMQQDIHLQYADSVNAPLSLYVVVTMGIISYSLRYHYSSKHNRPMNRAWKLYCLCLASFVVVKVTTSNEPKLCDSSKSTSSDIFTSILARFFHAIVIHSVISVLFSLATDCLFEIMISTQIICQQSIETKKNL